jgi:hypothetical protein
MERYRDSRLQGLTGELDEREKIELRGMSKMTIDRVCSTAADIVSSLIQ